MKNSRFRLKTTCHTKNEVNLKLNERRQIIDTNSEMSEVLEFSGEDFKAAMIKMLHQAITNTLEKKFKNRKRQQRESLNNAIEMQLKKKRTYITTIVGGLKSSVGNRGKSQ